MKILSIFAFALGVVVAGCGGGGSVDSDNDNESVDVEQNETPVTPASGDAPAEDVPAGLDALIGTLGFNYGFSNSADRFERRVTFSDSNRTTLSGVPLLINDTDGDWAGCEHENNLYVCIFIDALVGEADYFLFSLNQAGVAGEGRYERCVDPTDFQRCLADLYVNWDGDVLVTVSRSDQTNALALNRFLPAGGLVHDADNSADAHHYATAYKQAMPTLAAVGISVESVATPTGAGLAAAATGQIAR